MQTILAMLTRFGLFAHKSAHIDPRFDQRLTRLGARETCRAASGTPFRNPASRSAI